MGVFLGHGWVARADGRSFGKPKVCGCRLTVFGNLSYCCCRPINACQLSSCSLLASPRWMVCIPDGYDEQAMENRYIPNGHDYHTHLMGKTHLPMDTLNSWKPAPFNCRSFQHSIYHLLYRLAYYLLPVCQRSATNVIKPKKNPEI